MAGFTRQAALGMAIRLAAVAVAQPSPVATSPAGLSAGDAAGAAR